MSRRLARLAGIWIALWGAGRGEARAAEIALDRMPAVYKACSGACYLEEPGAPAEPPAINDPRDLRRFPTLRKDPGLPPWPWGTLRSLNGRKPFWAGKAAGVVPRIRGREVSGDSIRIRVDYLDPLGFSQADSHGFQYNIGGRVTQNPDEVLPERYWGAYPIYSEGQWVVYELELRNVGAEDAEGLSVSAQQEVFNRDGGAGQALPAPPAGFTVAAIPAGRSVRLRGSFQITSEWVHQGSLEQTHVRITSGRGDRERVLLDEAQAGLLDPPPPGE